MKKIIFVLSLLAFAQLNSAANFTTKPLPFYNAAEFLYKSVDFNISIIFPMAFEEKMDQIEVEGKIQETVEVSGSDGSGDYFASVTKHTIEMADHFEMAAESLDAFRETINAKIISEEIFTYKEHKGKQALMYLEEQKIYVHYKVILIGNNQYQMIVINTTKMTSKTVDDFFKSFNTLK
jgi:hypothetical protein